MLSYRRRSWPSWLASDLRKGGQRDYTELAVALATPRYGATGPIVVGVRVRTETGDSGWRSAGARKKGPGTRPRSQPVRKPVRAGREPVPFSLCRYGRIGKPRS